MIPEGRPPDPAPHPPHLLGVTGNGDLPLGTQRRVESIASDRSPFAGASPHLSAGSVVSYFLRYFSSTSTKRISPDSAGLFTSFDPVGFAIFATLRAGRFDGGAGDASRFLPSSQPLPPAHGSNPHQSSGDFHIKSAGDCRRAMIELSEPPERALHFACPAVGRCSVG